MALPEAAMAVEMRSLVVKFIACLLAALAAAHLPARRLP